MDHGEFYTASEYNAISEYKHFPAETYKKLNEENKCGNEGADLGNEATTLQHKRKPAHNGEGSKTLIDRIFNSIRGAATAATAAVATVAVAATLVTGAPKVELVSLECGDTYVEYEMEVGDLDEGGEYAIVVSTSNEEDVETRIDADGTHTGRVEGLKPEWEYTLALVQYDSLLGEVSHFLTKFQTLKGNAQQPIPPPEQDPIPNPDPEPDPAPPPSVEITGVEIVGINQIQIDFTYSDLADDAVLTLDLVYGDLSTDRLLLNSEDIERGYLIAAMSASDTVAVLPLVTSADGTVTECKRFTHTFDSTLSVEAMVGLYESVITFYPIGIANGAEYIRITSSAAPEAPEILPFEGVVEVWYSTAEPIVYTMYLTNEDGDVLSNEVSVSVDTSVELVAPDYSISCPNPGEVLVTYNDDGTINIYIDTLFESSSDDIYYQVTVGDIRYTSRDQVVRIEHIPDVSYALKYDVCVDIDGVQYSIFRTVPSGMANESYFYFQSDLADGILRLQLYKDAMYIDLNSVVLITSSGDRIMLSESDFVYNEEYGTYDVEVALDPYTAHVAMQVMANPYHNGIDDVADYAGNVRKLFEETVYQP